MKKKTIILSISAILAIIGLIYGISYFNNKSDVEILQNVEKLEILHGEKFELIDSLKDKYVIDYQMQDITNDDIKDDLILVGSKENQNDVFTKEIYLVVRNGKNDKFNKYEIKKLEGYECHIEFQEITNDDINEIIISVNKGGRKNNREYVVLQYTNGKFNEIFGIKNCEGLKIEGKFSDEYKGEIKVQNVKNNMMIDLSDKKEYYTRKGIYDENNKLINEEVSISSYPINMLEKVKLDDSTIGIKMYQNVMGVDKTDIIDVIESTWKYNKNSFEVISILSQKLGQLL